MTTPLWRNRDFALLWTSQVASTIGTRVTATLTTASPGLHAIPSRMPVGGG